jgi:hypothetical protein
MIVAVAVTDNQTVSTGAQSAVTSAKPTPIAPPDASLYFLLNTTENASLRVQVLVYNRQNSNADASRVIHRWPNENARR